MPVGTRFCTEIDQFKIHDLIKKDDGRKKMAEFVNHNSWKEHINKSIVVGSSGNDFAELA